MPVRAVSLFPPPDSEDEVGPDGGNCSVASAVGPSVLRGIYAVGSVVVVASVDVSVVEAVLICQRTGRELINA
jgi:hypothetical protein